VSRCVLRLAVDLDHVTVRIENEDLREPGVRSAIRLHAHGVRTGSILAVSPGAEVPEHGVEVANADREVNIAWVERLARAQSAVTALDQMQLTVTEREPRAGKVECGGALDLAQPQRRPTDAARPPSGLPWPQATRV
jgi:hypothetical protein